MTEIRLPARFRGFSPELPGFLRALEADPCPDTWPADARVTYAAHLLSPLKALVTDLEARLADVAELVVLEARVGASLSWPGGAPSAPEHCPVRTVRAWARGRRPDRSPLLFANFSSRGIEIGLGAEGGDPGATLRLRRSLASDAGTRAAAASLLAGGWTVTGDDPAPDAADGPADLRPWAWENGLRVTRRESWEPWIREPGFADELADRLRELLPVFERMLVEVSAPTDA